MSITLHHQFRPGKIGTAIAFPILTASLLINLLTVATPIAALLIYDRVLPNGTVPTLGVLLGSVAIIIVIDAMLRVARISILTRAGARIDNVNREKIISGFLTRRFPKPSGVTLGKLTSTLASVNALREQQILRLQAIVDVPFGLAFILLIAVIGGWLALIPASACVLFALLALGISHLNEKIARQHVRADDVKQGFVGSAFSNFRTIKGMAAEIPLVDRFVRLQRARSSVLRDQVFASMLSRDLYVMFSQILIAAVVVAGALAVLEGRFTLGGLAACTLLAGRALEPIQTGYQILVNGRSSRVAREQVDDLTAPDEVHEQLDSAEDADDWSKPPAIEIKGLTVMTAGGNAPLLKNVSLSVPGGSMVTIAGERGSGKTMLARAMLGIARATGSVHFDGERVDWDTVDGLRRRITYLPRVPDLPSGRLIDVLQDGEDGDFADIRYLSHLIGLDEAVKRLPDGYETKVGPDNLELPIGFRQQIALVRGIAKKRKVLFLDDTTFSLDATTEMRLAQLLKLMRGAATVVFLTDRPVMHALADQKLKIVDGNIEPMAQEGA